MASVCLGVVLAAAGAPVAAASSGVEVVHTCDSISTSTTFPTNVDIGAGRVSRRFRAAAAESATDVRFLVAAEEAGAPFAMGISDHLDQFAAEHGAETWKDLPDPVNWKPGVAEKLADPNQRVLFNMQGVDAWGGAARAAAGRGGATDWELLQIRNNDYPNLEFWNGGQQVPNPFK